MSAAAEQAELPADADEDQESRGHRRYSVQNTQVELVRHVYALAKLGMFQGHTTAQDVLIYYMFNCAVNDSKPRNFRRGYVMPGCTYPASAAKATTWSDEAVRKANTWLHEQRLIEITDVQPDGQRSIEILSWDAESEETRLKLLAEDGPREALKLKRGPRATKARSTTQEAPIPTAGGNISTVSGNTGGSISTDVDTYSSDSSIYKSDIDTPEPTSSASARVKDLFGGREEEAAARPVAAEAGAQSEEMPITQDITTRPEVKPRWYVDLDDDCYRPAIGRGRRRAGEVEFLGSEEELLRQYPSLASDTEPGSRDEYEISRPGRRSAERVSTEFWMGVSKGGNPYFTRDSRKGAVLVTLDSQETFQLLNLRGAQHLAHRQRLHEKYTSATPTSSAPTSSMMKVYLDDLAVHEMATQLAQDRTWGAEGVRRSLASWARSGLSTEEVKAKLAEHLAVAAG